MRPNSGAAGTRLSRRLASSRSSSTGRRFLPGRFGPGGGAGEILAFCQAARTRAGDAPVAADEADWLEWAEAYAVQLDPLQAPLRTPVDPPAGREVLRELAKIDAYAYPWPFDADSRWTLPDDRPTDPRT